jgi:hypothetical protein
MMPAGVLGELTGSVMMKKAPNKVAPAKKCRMGDPKLEELPPSNARRLGINRPRSIAKGS